MNRVAIKDSRAKKIRSFYPWVQREEVATADSPDPGLAHLTDQSGEFLAIGTWNPKSRFPFRVLSLEDEPITQEWFRGRFLEAKARREAITGTNAKRLVFSEADGLPGLIIDQFADHLVVQVRSLGMELLKSEWLPALIQVMEPVSIWESSEMAGRKEEGLGPIAQTLHGDPKEWVAVEEDGLEFRSLIRKGLKTGFYCDQRNLRRLVASRVKPGDKLLDCFCYGGAFSIHAARAGAETMGIDIHEEALKEARRAAKANGVECKFHQDNAFDWLQSSGKRFGPFDWVILDPPAIAKTRDKKKSLKWAIWNLVHRALPAISDGGRIVVSSCSYQLSQMGLLEATRLAASDRGVDLVLEDVVLQDVDHPAPISFPESLYLKSLVLRVERRHES